MGTSMIGNLMTQEQVELESGQGRSKSAVSVLRAMGRFVV